MQNVNKKLNTDEKKHKIQILKIQNKEKCMSEFL